LDTIVEEDPPPAAAHWTNRQPMRSSAFLPVSNEFLSRRIKFMYRAAPSHTSTGSGGGGNVKLSRNLQEAVCHHTCWPRPRGATLETFIIASSNIEEQNAACVKAAFSLLTTRGRLLWLYRSLCFMC